MVVEVRGKSNSAIHTAQAPTESNFQCLTNTQQQKLPPMLARERYTQGHSQKLLRNDSPQVNQEDP